MGTFLGARFEVDCESFFAFWVLDFLTLADPALVAPERSSFIEFCDAKNPSHNENQFHPKSLGILFCFFNDNVGSLFSFNLGVSVRFEPDWSFDVFPGRRSLCIILLKVNPSSCVKILSIAYNITNLEMGKCLLSFLCSAKSLREVSSLSVGSISSDSRSDMTQFEFKLTQQSSISI